MDNISKDISKKRIRKIIMIIIIIFIILLSITGCVGYKIFGGLNIDTNNDGIPDFKLDLDGDGVCDVNCTNKWSFKPEYNIDYLKN